MQDFFGATVVSQIFGSGYKIMPIIGINASGEGCSCPEFWKPTAPSGSIAFLVPFRWSAVTVSGTAGVDVTVLGINAKSLSGQDVHVVWFGFIVSAP